MSERAICDVFEQIERERAGSLSQTFLRMSGKQRC